MGELFAALFIMAVGLSAAGAGTHLYQAVSRNQAELSFAGETFIAAMGRLAMSFICGPYIMLKYGFISDAGDKPKVGTTLFASFLAFGWAFLSGLIVLGIHMAFTGG